MADVLDRLKDYAADWRTRAGGNDVVVDAFDEIEQLREALEVAKVGFEQIEICSSITDSEIKRVCLAKIKYALKTRQNDDATNTQYRPEPNGIAP